MGWTVLYVGFGLVALWLLGEVLLQYKARLRWRILAFSGFLGVVAGVLLHSVPLIVVGALAFAVGQTYVTLSFRRGFSTGWAIGGSPRVSRRRKGAAEGAVKEPALEVSEPEYATPAPDQEAMAGEDEGQQESTSEQFAHQQDAHQQGEYEQGEYEQSGYGQPGFEQPGFQQPGYEFPYGQPAYSENTYAQPTYESAGAMTSDSAAVYAPQPMPDISGQYGMCSDTAYGTAVQHGSYDTGYDQSQQQAGQYGYGSEEQQYNAPYADPYAGSGHYDASSYGGRQQYAAPYAGQYAEDTPPGGVWVPQQRENAQPPYGVPEQPVHEPQHDSRPEGYDNGSSEQSYRY